jgi:hypothetical protein
MDVRDEGDWRVGHDVRQCRRGDTIGNRDADDLGTDIGKILHLREDCLRIAGVGRRHGLDTNGVFTAEGNIADVKDARLAARSDEGHGFLRMDLNGMGAMNRSGWKSRPLLMQ